MAARKRLDEMKQFIKIAEGAWDLPRTKEDFDALADILRSKEPNIKIHDMLYNILGDDDLFDRLDKLDPHDHDAPETIIQWMKDQRKDKYSNFPNIWNTFQLSQREDSPMNEVGSTSLDDYREETDDEWEARISQSPIEDEDLGPAARGKSDILRKWGAEQSKEVTDLSLSELDEDPEDFKNTLQDPHYRPRRPTEIQKRKEWLARTTRSGKPIPDDLHMARVKTPRGIGTVYSVHNYEPSEASGVPTVSVRLDNDLGGYGGGKLQHIFKISDVEILPDELDEVGAVKFDDYGAVPVYEDDPEPKCPYCDDEEPVNDMPCLNCGSLQYVDEDHDPAGMGKYDVVIRSNYGEDYQTGVPIPYHHAEIKAEEAVNDIRANIEGDSLVTKIPAGSDMKYKIIDVEQDEVFWVVIEDVTNEYDESIDLGNIVENLLQEYPGQPKDNDLETDQAEFDTAIDAGAGMDDFLGEIDPEIADDELGYRFD